MTAFVLDCSVAVAWCFQDEADPATDALIGQLTQDGAIVPDIWRMEFLNVLLQAERRGRISEADVTARLHLFRQLPISSDRESGPATDSHILDLARMNRLTAYDASYLELAMRRALPLATKDRALRDAARRVGVPCLPAAETGQAS